MKFVVDANIIFSYFRKGSFTYNLLCHEALELFAPALLRDELKKYEKEICAKASIKPAEVHKILKNLSQTVTFCDIKDYSNSLQIMKKFSPDPKDTEYLALALHLGFPLWSRDKRLFEQNKVVVATTEDVAELLEEY